MEKKFNLVIQTPEKEIFNGQVVSLSMGLDGGRVMILSKHASLVGTISFGSMEVNLGEQNDKFLVRQGMLNFDNSTNTCRVMAYYCELESEISMEDSKDYLEFVESQLAAGKDLSEFQVKYLENEKIAVSKQISR